MSLIIFNAFCFLSYFISVLCDIGQCRIECPKRNKFKKSISSNIEVMFEYKKGVIRLPDTSNYVEENRMLPLSDEEIIPQVSMRLPLEFTVNPVAANCGSKDFLGKIKALRKNIKCMPRPVIVSVLSNEGQVVPNKVLTKECSGLCNGQKVCTAVRTVNTSHPVQILLNYGGNIKCSTILVPEDIKCRCKCALTKKDCNSKQKYDRKLCKCLCKNEVEQAHCLKKAKITHQHAWNMENCSCDCINKTPCTTGTFWDKSRCRCSKKSDNG